MYNVAQVTGARKAWASGLTGSGVDVALIDSGVTPVAGLDDAGKVVNGPDLSFESQNSGTRYLDTFGHGTFMAGIIAGYDGTLSNGSLSDTYNGVAPNARVISLKVADAHGNTDVSQVIAAIDWVVQHRKDPGMNIRVLNLSFGTPSMQSYLLDPLSYAAEVAWRKGIVVVVSAGNDGTGTGKLLNPAQDPYVLSVGAEDPLPGLLTSLRGRPLPKGFIAFGEVGLAGEVRPAPRGQERLKEAAKLGFSVAVVPKANAPKKPIEGLTIHAVERVEEAMNVVRGLG